MSYPGAPGPVPDGPPPTGEQLIDQSFQGLATIPDNRVLQRFDTLEAAKGNQEFALSAVQGPQLVRIYAPGMPIRMVSALDPTALQPGEFSLLQNVRPDADVITARQPTTLFGLTSTTGLSAATACRGCWSGNLNGTQLVVAAYYDGSKVRLYASSDGHSFTERTASSGAYGNTRMADSGSNCFFQSVTCPENGIDYLVIQNGADTPRLLTTAAVNGAYVANMTAISPPVALSTQQAAFGAVGSFPMGNGSGWSTTTSGTMMVGAKDTSSGTAGSNASLKLSFANATSSIGDNVVITFTNPVDMSLWATLSYLTTYTAGVSYSLPLYCKVEIYNSGSWETVFDPSVQGLSGYNPEKVGQLSATATSSTFNVYWAGSSFGSGASGYGISCDSLDLSNLAASSRNSVTQIRWTFVGTLTSSGGPWYNYIFAIFGGSSFSSEASYAVSYLNSASQTESPSVVLEATTDIQAPITSLGAGATVFGGSKQTVSGGAVSNQANTSTYIPALWWVDFAPQVPFFVSSQISSCVDTVNIYRQDVGSSVYLFVESTVIAAYSGSWSASYTGNSASQPYYLTDTVASPSLVASRMAPDAYSIPVPQGTCMASASGRMFVGAGSSFYISEYNFPFRFRLLLDVENNQPRPSSGSFVSLPNTEKCSAFAVTGASGLGTNTVYLFTDKSTYAIQGIDALSLSQPTLLASVGCSSPGSVAVYKDAIFFLDDNYQIRKFSYGRSQIYLYANANAYELMQPISRRVVDDQTRSIPSSRISSSVGFAAYDRYYFAYTPAGGSWNTKVLVWDETIGCFVSDTLPSGASVEAFAGTTVSGSKKLFVQSSDLGAYDYENASGTAAVAVVVTTRSLNTGAWAPTFYGRVGVLADVQASASMAVSKTLIGGSSATDASTIDMSTNAVGQILRWDSRSSAPGGQSGVACQISLSASLSPGNRVFAIVQEQMPAGVKADAL